MAYVSPTQAYQAAAAQTGIIKGEIARYIARAVSIPVIADDPHSASLPDPGPEPTLAIRATLRIPEGALGSDETTRRAVVALQAQPVPVSFEASTSPSEEG